LAIGDFLFHHLRRSQVAAVTRAALSLRVGVEAAASDALQVVDSNWT